MANQLVYVRRSMNYGGEDLDSLQVVELKGLRNDTMLLELGHFTPVPKGANVAECGECGAAFLNEAARERHGDRHHNEHYREPQKPPLITEALKRPDLQNAALL